MKLSKHNLIRSLLLATAALPIAGAARAQDYAAPLRLPEPEKPAPVLTKPPKIVKSVEPTYPPAALEAKQAADVTMTIDIDATGHVTKVEIPKPVGNGFDEAAKAAVLQYEFSPAEVDGKPSAIRISFTLHFVPKVAPPPPPPEPEAPPPPPPPPPPPARVVVGHVRLREKGTRNPVKNAEVSVIARPVGAPEAAPVLGGTTDVDGRFVVEAEPGVPLRVIVADAAHDPCIRDVDASKVSASAPFDVDCVVAKRLGKSYETTVRAAPPAQAVTRYTLTQPELTSVPGTFGDPVRVIQNLPGVARTPYGLGLLVIRGASPSDSGIYVEGHQVPILYHFLAGPSVFTPRLIKDIEFYPGNFGVKYGRATGGIVDVDITSEPTERLHGQAEINILDSSAYIEGPLAKGWTGSVSARRSYYDLWLPLVTTGGTTVAPVYWDYQATVHRELPNGRIALFAFGSNDSFNVVSKDPSEGNLSLDTSTGFHKVIGIWTYASHGWVNRLSPAYGYEKLTFGAGQVGINQSQNAFELRDELSRALGKHVVWRVGFDGVRNLSNLYLNVGVPEDTRLYGDSQPVLKAVTIPLDTLALGLYTDATWEPGYGLTITPGLRTDYFRYVGQNRNTFDPRIVVRWKTSPRQTWKAGAGIFHQMQEPQLLDPTYGTPSLPPIWAQQYSAGFVRNLTDKLSLDTTFYFVERYNEPVAVTGGFTPTGRQRSYGMEMILKHEFTERFFGWIAYTLSRSEQTAYTVNGASTSSEGQGALQTGATGTVWYPTDYDQTHNLIAVGSYAWKAWRFGTRFRLVTGAPDTAMYEGAYDADTGVYACRQGPTNGTRKPTFNQLDLRAERTWTFNAWQLGAYLDVQNVYNAQNPELTIYDYRCRGSEPVRGIPFLPVLGVRGIF